MGERTSATGRDGRAILGSAERCSKAAHTAVIIGLGEDTDPDSRYGGHWTCVERITKRMVYLCDSDVYRRIPRTDTGIRPEPRWAIEDCFILSRVT